jgi:hypothetical protein
MHSRADLIKRAAELARQPYLSRLLLALALEELELGALERLVLSVDRVAWDSPWLDIAHLMVQAADEEEDEPADDSVPE